MASPREDWMPETFISIMQTYPRRHAGSGHRWMRYVAAIRHRQWHQAGLCTRAAAVLNLFPWCCSLPLRIATLAFRFGSGQIWQSSTCVAYKLARRRSLQWFVTFSMPMTALMAHTQARPAALQPVPECRYPLWPDSQPEEDGSYATTSQPSPHPHRLLS